VIKTVVSTLEKVFCFSKQLMKLYSGQYKAVLNKEIGLADISESDTLLNVGCGALPFTALHILRKTGNGAMKCRSDKTDLSCLNLYRNLNSSLGNVVKYRK
jgi:hypothetical protein